MSTRRRVGVMCSLRDPAVVETARRYGDRVDLQEGFVP
jgi:hypothetical protein